MSKDATIPNSHEVYWEKWVDAYDQKLEAQLPPESTDHEEEAYEGYDEALEEELMNSFHSIKTIFTPFGIMPLTEQSLASRHFKFWVGHTNFKLTKSFYQIVSGVRGVETIDILTPYRFRIGVGQMFRDRNVMSTVRTKMLEHVNGQQAQSKG